MPSDPNDLCLMHWNLLPKQTSDLLVINRVHVGLYGVLPRWCLLRDVGLLDNLDLSLLNRAGQVHSTDLITEPHSLLDQFDETKRDFELDIRAFSDVLLKVALCLDCEALSDDGRVRLDVDVVDVQDIVVCCFTVDQGVLAGYGIAVKSLL